MATQTIEFESPSGLTGLTAKLYAVGSDTVAYTASAVTESTNRKGIYQATFTSIAAATYQLVVTNATSKSICSWFGYAADTASVFWFGGSFGYSIKNAISSETLTDSTLAAAKIADNAITANKIATDAITSAKIADNAFTTAKFSDGVFTSAKFAASALNGKGDWLLSSSYTAPDNATIGNIHLMLTAVQTVTSNTSLMLVTVKAVTDKLDTMLVADGSVHQFTANALELGPTSSPVVVTLPLTADVPQRTTGRVLEVFTNETITISVPVRDADGNTINMTGWDIWFMATDKARATLVSVAATGNSTGFSVTIAAPSTQHLDGEWSLRRNNSTKELLSSGLFKVSWRPMKP